MGNALTLQQQNNGLQNLQQYLQADSTKIQQALMRFPEGYRDNVFNKYQVPQPIEKAVEEPAPSFGVATKQYGRESTKFWLRYQIANTFALIGVYDQLNPAQIQAAADDILDDEIYGQYTFAEFLAFLQRFRMGRYGKIYSTNRPNLQEFLMALKPFWEDLQIERGRAQAKQQEEQRDKDLQEWRRTAVSREQYLKMRKDGTLKDHISPELWEQVRKIEEKEQKAKKEDNGKTEDDLRGDTREGERQDTQKAEGGGTSTSMRVREVVQTCLSLYET